MSNKIKIDAHDIPRQHQLPLQQNPSAMNSTKLVLVIFPA